ncbi:MAG: GWxTD domain-containing protein [bacterium]
MFTNRTILLAAFLLNAFLFSLPIHTHQNDYYTRGQQFRKQGEWKKALKIWQKSRTALEMLGKSDPIIGRAFIELATEMHAKEEYAQATEIYFWGFSKVDTSIFRDELRQEIAFLEPLLSKAGLPEWRLTLEQGGRKFYLKLKQFWTEQDPIPTTPQNERLLEHWERIAFARKNLQKNKTPPYGADDRAKIYVKYGQPDKKRTGQFGNDVYELKSLLNDHRDTLMPSWRTPLNSYIDDLLFYEMKPEYEVWIYYGLGTKESAVFVFGPYEGNGEFGLRNGLEELISKKAFTKNPVHYFKFDPGLYFQYNYYALLKDMDPFFEDRYWNLWRQWEMPLQPKMVFLGMKRSHRADRVNKGAVVNKSDYIEEIEVSAKSYRLLDEKNNPYQIVFVSSDPRITPIPDSTVPENVLKHTLISRNKEFDEIERYEHFPVKHLENASFFVVQHLPSIHSLTIAAEAWEPKSLQAVPNDTTIKKIVYGIGKQHLPSRFPLPSNPDSLQISDLVLGKMAPPELDEREFPIPLIPGERFYKSDPLRLYLEVYHLAPDENGNSHFDLDFLVLKLDKKGRPKKKKSKITQVFSFTSASQTSKEHVGIDISNLGKGRYEVHVRITDRLTLQTRTRRAKFEVMK